MLVVRRVSRTSSFPTSNFNHPRMCSPGVTDIAMLASHLIGWNVPLEQCCVCKYAGDVCSKRTQQAAAVMHASLT